MVESAYTSGLIPFFTSEYILVAQFANNEIEVFSENLYNEFIKDFK